MHPHLFEFNVCLCVLPHHRCHYSVSIFVTLLAETVTVWNAVLGMRSIVLNGEFKVDPGHQTVGNCTVNCLIQNGPKPTNWKEPARQLSTELWNCQTVQLLWSSLWMLIMQRSLEYLELNLRTPTFFLNCCTAQPYDKKQKFYWNFLL